LKQRWSWRRLGIEVDVPDRAVTAARRIFRRKGGAQPRGGMLEVVRSLPALHVRPREPAVTEYVKNIRATVGWYPDGWGSAETLKATDLPEAIERLSWYHTIELPGGVVTNGYYDHRPLVPHYGIPSDLRGKRVLDVGAWDGFWSFEFERRGAEVTVVDLDHLTKADLPPQMRSAVLDADLEQPFGIGFEIARRALNSKVRRIGGSVYNLDPAVLGTFDLVHFADIALHLERPLDAFRNLRAVTSGQAMIVDMFDPSLDDPSRFLTEYRGGWVDVHWWNPSLDTLAQMVIDAGFSDVRVHKIYRLDAPAVSTPGQWRAILFATP
jgi:tRNA (mo5U34)-methyltransferase